MQSQLQNTKNTHDYQHTFSNILEKVRPLYEQFVPASVKNRRNIEQQIQPDCVIISSIIWACMLGFTDQNDPLWLYSGTAQKLSVLSY